jgi:hypothetical protein
MSGEKMKLCYGLLHNTGTYNFAYKFSVPEQHYFYAVPLGYLPNLIDFNSFDRIVINELVVMSVCFSVMQNNKE